MLKRVRKTFISFILLINLVFPIQTTAQNTVKVGTKIFTESVILGEIVKQSAESAGLQVDFYPQLGGTRILWNAMKEGEISVYTEYTGTLINEIYSDTEISGIDELKMLLSRSGIGMSNPLGFNNTYAIGMNRETADSLGIEKISDLRDHPELRYGFSNEFVDRSDGWKGLKADYDIGAEDVRGMDHDLAYRGLESRNIDVIDLYSTDAEIKYYNIKMLKDDKSYFPEYKAVILYDLELQKENPDFLEILSRLEGVITEKAMIKMNAAVKIDGRGDAGVASDFLRSAGIININFENSNKENWTDRLIRNTWDHLYLVGISLGLAIITAIPLGIIAAKVSVLEGMVMSLTGIMQTIPSLALLVFMIPLFGIGAVPAMAALFLYSLLPVVRNTHAGIRNVSSDLINSARAMGLPGSVILRKVELPLALSSILAGIKTSAVINIGTATLGALIGAGGYGQPILTGIRLDDTALILEGAIPAALMALLAQGLFDLLEKMIEN